MHVEIYTATTVRGARQKDGKYGAVAVCRTSKGPAEVGKIKEEEQTTFHRAALLAVLLGLEMLADPCTVEVHTPDPLIVTMVEEGNLEKWQREEWKRPQGKKLHHKELWKQLFEQMEKHDLHFVYTKCGDYQDRLMAKMDRNT